MRFSPKLIFLTATLWPTPLVFASPQSATAAKSSDAARARQLVGAQSEQVVRALQNNETRVVARFVQAQRGLKISPYIFVASTARRWLPAQIARLAKDGRKYFWGRADGSGDPIQLGWNHFRRRFLVPVDFSRAAQIGFNRFPTRGNTHNNLRGAFPAETFPGVIFVEYYRPASSKSRSDWYSLWLVWQSLGNRWFLTGLAADGWTT